MTWVEFQQLFNINYYNVIVRASKVDKFTTLSQGNMTVTEYDLKFDRLAKFPTDIVPTNAARVDHFIRGIKPMIALDVHIVSVRGSSTYDQILERALTVERMEDRIWKEDNGGQPSQDRRSKNYKNNGRTENKEWVRYPECEKCKKHHPKECRANACFACGKEGHIIKNCPQQGQNNNKDQPKKHEKLVLARVYALAKEKAEASTFMDSGQISIAGIDFYVLIDSGATHSFVAKRTVDKFDRYFDMYAEGFGTMLPSE
ncbi:uncharacterized protein LOC133814763 [Humulus lupulus]|uniref:uncharacterized protein LOC133814763 n=1 Tax=Humulus lupulus TaxID=3486 RepID=UPI002B40A9B7|nr:uncharacterized protein LOC133814763 [Humulus lupulus]